MAEVAVERRAAQPNQVCCVVGDASLSAGVLRDRELVRDHQRVRVWTADPLSLMSPLGINHLGAAP